MNKFLKPSRIVAILAYIVIYLFISSIIMVIGIGIECSIHSEFAFSDYLNTMATINSESIYYISYQRVSTATQFISYFMMAIIVGFYLRNYLLEDAKKIRKNWKFTLIFTFCAMIVFYFVNFAFEKTIGTLIKGDSDNQESIEAMIKYGNLFFNFLSIVILAPFVEELIYRKCVFEGMKGSHIVFSYVLSCLFFTFPHMITTKASADQWLLLALGYLLPAIMLCLAYHKGKHNVYVSMSIHVLNNLLVFLALVL